MLEGLKKTKDQNFSYLPQNQYKILMTLKGRNDEDD